MAAPIAADAEYARESRAVQNAQRANDEARRWHAPGFGI
jgi:hypothetical protein